MFIKKMLENGPSLFQIIIILMISNNCRKNCYIKNRHGRADNVYILISIKLNSILVVIATSMEFNFFHELSDIIYQWLRVNTFKSGLVAGSKKTSKISI